MYAQLWATPCQATAVIPLLSNLFNSPDIQFILFFLHVNYLAIAIIGAVPVCSWRIIDLISIQLAPSERGPGDSFVFIYRLLNWISDQWRRTVCSRALRFKLKRGGERERDQEDRIDCIFVQKARFRNSADTVLSKNSRTTAGHGRSYLVQRVKGDQGCNL